MYRSCTAGSRSRPVADAIRHSGPPRPRLPRIGRESMVFTSGDRYLRVPLRVICTCCGLRPGRDLRAWRDRACQDRACGGISMFQVRWAPRLVGIVALATVLVVIAGPAGAATGSVQVGPTATRVVLGVALDVPVTVSLTCDEGSGSAAGNHRPQSQARALPVGSGYSNSAPPPGRLRAHGHSLPFTCDFSQPIVTAGARCAPLAAGRVCTQRVPLGPAPSGGGCLLALRFSATRGRDVRPGTARPRTAGRTTLVTLPQRPTLTAS